MKTAEKINVVAVIRKLAVQCDVRSAYFYDRDFGWGTFVKNKIKYVLKINLR